MERSFTGCFGLRKIDFGIESSLKSIKAFVFDGCKLLHSILVPASVETIENSGFEGSSFISIMFEGGVFSKLRSLKRNSFRGCNMLESLNLPNSLSVIEPDALLGCTSLVRISFESVLLCEFGLPLSDFRDETIKPTFRVSKDGRSILSSDGRILVACPSARDSYGIEESITEIAPTALRNTRVSSCNLGNVITFGDRCFEGTNLNKANLSSAHSIGERSFADCKYLVVLLSEGKSELKRIESEAFSNSPHSFGAVTFNDDLEYIGENAFRGVSDFSRIVYCGNGDFLCSKSSFGSIPSVDVRVTVGESYKWNNFCGLDVRKTEGNPCIAPTVHQRLNFSKEILSVNALGDPNDE